jgi:catechol 2,3-dioxygenase-like lactoylglutathione lyase family enzyme
MVSPAILFNEDSALACQTRDLHLTWKHEGREVVRMSCAAPFSSGDAATRNITFLEYFMHARITVITLGVENLERAVAFYRDGLGLPTQGIVGEEFENGAVAFFDLQNGLKLALWPRSSMAADAGLPLRTGGSLEFSLGHNVSSKDEVDAVMAQATSAGATLVKAAADTFYGGYGGYFTDPDGHLWEAVYNPQMLPRG